MVDVLVIAIMVIGAIVVGMLVAVVMGPEPVINGPNASSQLKRRFYDPIHHLCWRFKIQKHPCM